jgi:hypothetical protein
MVASTVLSVPLMMGAQSTRNMYSNLAVKNKCDCLKLHLDGYLIKHKKCCCSANGGWPAVFVRLAGTKHHNAHCNMFLFLTPEA